MSLFATGERELQLAMAEEEGFHGLLQNLANWFTEAIVKPWHPDLVMIFDGLKQEKERDRIEIMSKAVSSFWTIDEARAVENKEPLPNGLGKYPLPVLQLAMRGGGLGGPTEGGQAAPEAKNGGVEGARRGGKREMREEQESAPEGESGPHAKGQGGRSDRRARKSLAKSLVIEVIEP